jgi:hypothetical protein
MLETVAVSNELRTGGDWYVEDDDHIGAVVAGRLRHLRSTDAPLSDGWGTGVWR